MITRDYIKLVEKIISDEVRKCTIAIYTLSNNTYTLHCNGVLFTDVKNFFIITAEHVFDGVQPSDLKIFQNGSFCNLEGTIVGDQMNDIALFKIDEAIVPDLIHNYQFLDRSNLLYNHQTESKQNYLFIGYPSSKTHIKRAIIFEKLQVYHSAGIPNKYKPNEIHFVYNKRKSVTYNKRGYTFAPDPDGLSGSGLWYISSYSEPIKYKLVGLFKEFDRKKNIGIATTIDSIR